jgi:hypothetical protein
VEAREALRCPTALSLQGISLLKDEFGGAVTFAHCAAGRFLEPKSPGGATAARRAHRLDY